MLKRVLLAYARHNQAIGYCQGFNILAALILKVVDFDERMALMVRGSSCWSLLPLLKLKHSQPLTSPPVS